MKDIVNEYANKGDLGITINLTKDEFEQLVLDVVLRLTNLDLTDLLSTSLVGRESSSVGIFIDRVMLDPEEEEIIDFLYENSLDCYIEPSQLFVKNILKQLFSAKELDEVTIKAVNDDEVYGYELMIPYGLYQTKTLKEV